MRILSNVLQLHPDLGHVGSRSRSSPGSFYKHIFTALALKSQTALHKISYFSGLQNGQAFWNSFWVNKDQVFVLPDLVVQDLVQVKGFIRQRRRRQRGCHCNIFLIFKAKKKVKKKFVIEPSSCQCFNLKQSPKYAGFFKVKLKT